MWCWGKPKRGLAALDFVLAIAASACASSDSGAQPSSDAVAETSASAAPPTTAVDPGIVQDREAAYTEFSALLGSFGGATFSSGQAELLAEVDCGRIASAASAATFEEGWNSFNAQRIEDGLDGDVLRTLTLVAVSAYCPQWNVAVGASFNPDLLLADSTAVELGNVLRLAVEEGEMPQHGADIVADAFVESDAYTDEQKANFAEALAG